MLPNLDFAALWGRCSMHSSGWEWCECLKIKKKRSCGGYFWAEISPEPHGGGPGSPIHAGIGAWRFFLGGFLPPCWPLLGRGDSSVLLPHTQLLHQKLLQKIKTQKVHFSPNPSSFHGRGETLSSAVRSSLSQQNANKNCITRVLEILFIPGKEHKSKALLAASVQIIFF